MARPIPEKTAKPSRKYHRKLPSGRAAAQKSSLGRLSGENRYPQGRSSRHTGLYKSLQLKDLTSSHLANELHLSFRPGCAGRSQATWTWRCPWAFGSLKAYGGSGRVRVFLSSSLPHVPLKPPTSPAATSARKPRVKAKESRAKPRRSSLRTTGNLDFRAGKGNYLLGGQG